MNPFKPTAASHIEEGSAFASLQIWRNKITEDVGHASTEDLKLRLLLEQTKDLETAVYGCFKDALFELHEAAAWGLLCPVFEEAQRARLKSQAMQELSNDKNLMLQLAREQGLAEAYERELIEGRSDTVSDYETIGELRFALLAWKAGLKRDLSMKTEAEEAELTLAAAYRDAMALVRRCVGRSVKWWAAQQSGSAPGKKGSEKVEAAAGAKVRSALLEVTETHHLGGREVVERAIARGAEMGEDGQGRGEDRYEMKQVEVLQK